VLSQSVWVEVDEAHIDLTDVPSSAEGGGRVLARHIQQWRATCSRVSVIQDAGSGSNISPNFGGSGMNSPLSRSGNFMRPACQSSRA
jgi:hypothetical protein